ncbi:MAG: hypothetical protein J2P21_05235 [Chloracidobacterium sp.]|nr:hypothetical protein [Chloracidobacterium sp.]
MIANRWTLGKTFRSPSYVSFYALRKIETSLGRTGSFAGQLGQTYTGWLQVSSIRSRINIRSLGEVDGCFGHLFRAIQAMLAVVVRSDLALRGRVEMERLNPLVLVEGQGSLANSEAVIA